jgi:glycosyltransferase involved in cell wall biosynthesis
MHQDKALTATNGAQEQQIADSAARVGGELDSALHLDHPGAVDLSVIVPIYNEEEILEKSILGLLNGLEGTLGLQNFELILCENGSRDRSLAIARSLASSSSRVRVESLDIPSYGRALRHGIHVANGNLLIIFNADLWDLDFARIALNQRTLYDMLIGTKNARYSVDERPLHRRAITRSFNLLLRVMFGFEGTDTHGMKALEAYSLKPIVAQCQTEDEIFDTELVLRAQRAGLLIAETPVRVREWRPSRYGLVARIPKTIRDLVLLMRTLATDQFSTARASGKSAR